MVVPDLQLETNEPNPRRRAQRLSRRGEGRAAQNKQLGELPNDAIARRSLSNARSPSRVRLDAFSRSLPTRSLPAYFDAKGDSNGRAMMMRGPLARGATP